RERYAPTEVPLPHPRLPIATIAAPGRGKICPMKDRARFVTIAKTSMDVAATSSRRAKIELLAACLASLTLEEVPVAVAYLSGALPQRSIGVGWATVRDLPTPTTEIPTLELLEVDGTLRRVSALSGAGSQVARRR